MAVFRVERNKGYTVMSNHHLRNKELTLKAKGLLSQMNLSRSTVKRALHDLTGAGLIEKEPRYRENGSHTSNRLLLK